MFLNDSLFVYVFACVCVHLFGDRGFILEESGAQGEGALPTAEAVLLHGGRPHHPVRGNQVTLNTLLTLSPELPGNTQHSLPTVIPRTPSHTFQNGKVFVHFTETIYTCYTHTHVPTGCSGEGLIRAWVGVDSLSSPETGASGLLFQRLS